jgi:N-acyl homoserine lactone hydrolase
MCARSGPRTPPWPGPPSRDARVFGIAVPQPPRLQPADLHPTYPVTDIEIVPLELSEFTFPDPELAGRHGVVMGYAIRHPGGVLLFDTGFGFGDEELDERYHPVGRPILEVLSDAGIHRDDVTALANCHLHADHAGQNREFPGVPIYVQSTEWQLAHTTDHTILEWIDGPETSYVQVEGDHEVALGLRLLVTPGHTSGHQSLLVDTADVSVVLAGQACYTAGEWDGDPDALEGHSGAPDPTGYRASLQRLRDLDPGRVLFAHDRAAWTARTASGATPARLPGPC